MKLMQDLIKKRKIYQILSLLLILLDLVALSSMEILDLKYTIEAQEEEYMQKVILFAVKIILIIVFMIFLIFILILKYVNTLLIAAIAYLVIGVILFCYLLIDQLKTYHSYTDPRPVDYYNFHIDKVIIILNITAGFFRIAGGIIIIFFITILQIEKKRNDVDNLIKLNRGLIENANNSELPNYSSNIENCVNPNIQSNDYSNRNIHIYNVTISHDHLKKSFIRKTSMASDSAESYRKFETPKAISKFSS